MKVEMPERLKKRLEGEYLTPIEVSVLLKIDTRTVQRYLKLGKIPGKLVGTKWRCKRSEIDKIFS